MNYTKRNRSLFILFFLILFTSACWSRGPSKPKNPTSQARVNLPNWGVTIDANYDAQLDGLVPGYKIVTIALTNHSVDVIKLDAIQDQWVIEDAWGKKQRGIAALRIKDPKTWTELPPRVRDLIEYPAGVQMGYTQTFDLFFPEHIELENFRTISFYSANLKQNFDAISSASLEKAVPASKEETTEAAQRKTPNLFEPVSRKKRQIPPYQAPKTNQKYQ